jgi:hypothetical protein
MTAASFSGVIEDLHEREDHWEERSDIATLSQTRVSQDFLQQMFTLLHASAALSDNDISTHKMNSQSITHMKQKIQEECQQESQVA